MAISHRVLLSTRLTASSLVSKGIVLSALVGIGWLGHAGHWTLPGVSIADATRESSSSSPAARSQDNSLPDNVAASGSSLGTFPPVKFRSAAAAHNCGIECATAQSRLIKYFVAANGVIDYDQGRFAQLSVRVPGVVRRVDKRVGDLVQTGDVLAIIDSAEVGQAKATLLETAARYRFDVQTAERLEKVQGAIPMKDILAGRAAVEASRTQLFNAVQRMMALGLPLRSDDIASLSATELADHLQGLGLPPPYDTQAPSANLISLVAPFSGVVTNCDIVRGEMVDTTKPQYVIADIDHLWINLAVREEEVPKLHVGARVEFTGDIGTSCVNCTLTWIGTEVDPRTRTVKARAEGENPRLDSHEPDYETRRQLQIGSFGTARIITGDSQAAVTVPNDALHWQWEIGHEVIFIPSSDASAFTPRIVTKGGTRDGFAQILTGLSPGEPIVVAGARILSSELSELLRHRLACIPQAREFNQADAALATTDQGE